ncbi:hypothetical protein ASPCAL02433 [Aspergillus calidoustus]|uniref:Uncharacterized protein n=1 Tax=Aspergillus calidoustus TaxID=454130 RepID=A0A0U5GMQ4_ASPCI|nr:hypothetical protein ASPCAL02433 [Aspergillus calidoustus]
MLIPDEPTGLLGNLQMAIWASRMHYTYEAHERTRRRSWWETNRIIPFVLGNGLTAVAAAANPATAITYAAGFLIMHYSNTGDPLWNAVCRGRLSLWRQRNGRLIERFERLRELTAELEQKLEQTRGQTQAST